MRTKNETTTYKSHPADVAAPVKQVMMHVLVGIAGGAVVVVSCATAKEAAARTRVATANFIVSLSVVWRS